MINVIKFNLDDEEYYNRILEGDTLTEWVYVEQPNKIEQFKGWYQNKKKQMK